MEPEPKRCPLCDKVTTMCCSACNRVYYCSKEHQKQHWRRHKHDCRPFKEASDEEVGRHLVATRNIKAGEVVLREKPLLRGPPENSPAVCLSCLVPVDPTDSVPCPKCDWLLCAQQSCLTSAEHFPECEWASLRKRPPCPVAELFQFVFSTFQTPSPDYAIVSILRLCYARLCQPELWSRLSTLQTHTAKRIHTMKYQEYDRHLAQHLLATYDLRDKLTEDDILDMLGILEVNAFNAGDGKKGDFIAVYHLSSMIEHSCLPNCYKTFSAYGEITFTAARDIHKGDHISISYVNRFWGTTRRFKQLLKTKHFICRCVRCTDNTEMGSYYSAVLCQAGGCGGPMLPDSLCTLAPATPWVCSRCGASTPNITVKLLLKRINQDLSTLNKKNYSELLKFLDTWKSKLHYNHYILVEVQKAMVPLLHQECPKRVGGQRDKKYNFKIELCFQLSNLRSLIAPGGDDS